MRREVPWGDCPSTCTVTAHRTNVPRAVQPPGHSPQPSTSARTARPHHAMLGIVRGSDRGGHGFGHVFGNISPSRNPSRPRRFRSAVLLGVGLHHPRPGIGRRIGRLGR